MAKLYILFALLACFVGQSHSISLVLQKMEPYCFLLDVKVGNEIKVNYVLSGLNEDQVEFKVISSVHTDILCR